MADKDDDEKIGYKRPPKRTQFKKGQSGNKNGRPKKRNDIASTFARTLAEPLTYREGDTLREMPAAEALLYAQVGKAMQGDQSAFNAVMMRAQECGLIRTSRADLDGPRGLFTGKTMSDAEWCEEARKQQAASKIANQALWERMFDE